MKISSINFIKKKKHIENFFISKNKKYIYFYKKKKRLEIKFNNNNFSKKLNSTYCLQAKEDGYLTLDSLKAVLKLIKWYSRKFNFFLRYHIFFFPDFVLTKKPKEVRMGKGKGAPFKKVANIKKNKILFEFTCKKDNIYMKYLLKNCKIKLNLKTKIYKNLW